MMIPEIPLSQYQPRPQIVIKETNIPRSRFPAIDIHNHLGDEFGAGWCKRPVQELLDVMDQANIEALVDLDGGWGENVLQQRIEQYKNPYPQRFICFGGVDWDNWCKLGNRFPEWAAQRLGQQASWGAQGLKIWKNFGLTVKDQFNEMVKVDDPRLHPIWQTAAELKLPVIIHVADPVAFFQPLDQYNERWEELNSHPNWHFYSPTFPEFASILEQFANLVRKNQNTIFIGAHVGCYAENLTWVSQLMDQCENFYVDIAARLAELGRQPFTARSFFERYQDRVIFGTDSPPNPQIYQRYFQFLESDDEYFNYDIVEPPGQGRWRIYGVQLPDNILKKIYRLNARKIFYLSTT